MSYKAEIGWTRQNADDVKISVYAHHVGKRWLFYRRERRFDPWQAMEKPPLEDWRALLDAVQRRIARRMLRPEEEGNVRNRIRELYPDAEV